jgi:putative ABC transport system permease protein
LRSAQLVFKNAFRARLRAAMTVLTVGVMLAGFVFPRTLIEAQAETVRATPNDRVVTISKQGFGGFIPKQYADEIREFPGVRTATGLAFTAFKLPGRDDFFFGSGALEAEPFIDMHDELVGDEEGKQAFVKDPRGAIASEDLALELSWKRGDRLIFESRFLPGSWEVELRAIVESTRPGWGQRTVWVHYDHFNKGVPRERQDKMSLIAAEIFEPNQGGRISQEVDRHFDARQFRTLTREDHVMWAANKLDLQTPTAAAVISRRRPSRPKPILRHWTRNARLARSPRGNSFCRARDES